MQDINQKAPTNLAIFQSKLFPDSKDSQQVQCDDDVYIYERKSEMTSNKHKMPFKRQPTKAGQATAIRAIIYQAIIN